MKLEADIGSEPIDGRRFVELLKINILRVIVKEGGRARVLSTPGISEHSYRALAELIVEELLIEDGDELFVTRAGVEAAAR